MEVLRGFLTDPKGGLIAIVTMAAPHLTQLGVDDVGSFDLGHPSVDGNPIVAPLVNLWLLADTLGWPREEAAARLKEAQASLPIVAWDGQGGRSYRAAVQMVLGKSGNPS
jgi:hypothetical protein